MDPRTEFVSRIDISKTRVRAFEGFIFLCGGERGSNPVPICSVRHLLYHEITSGKHRDLADRLRLAEDVQDWFRDGNYRDLIAFEEDIAGLSAVIVLVVEGAGAICELGAFAVSSAFTDRMLVIVAERHYESDSFIKLGPIRRIENISDKSVLVYDWHVGYGRVPQEDYSKLDGEVAGIVEAIRDFTSPNRSERHFNSHESSHVMFMICELCDLFGALSLMEIHEYLTALGIAIEQEVLKRFLFLLEKFDLLRIKPKGHGRYYYSPEWRSHISFSFTPGAAIDKERLRVDVAAYYEQAMKTRAEVLHKIRHV